MTDVKNNEDKVMSTENIEIELEDEQIESHDNNEEQFLDSNTNE